MKHNQKGYLPFTGLYSSRYYAKKHAAAGQVVVKTPGGYAILSAEEYAAHRAEIPPVHRSPVDTKPKNMI